MSGEVIVRFYVVCISFGFIAIVPLIPHAFDAVLPIHIKGITLHEILGSLFIYIFSWNIFSLYYKMVTFETTKTVPKAPSLHKFLPIIISLTMSIEGNGIHWSTNTIHSLLNPGQQKLKNPSSLHELTYILDEIIGHHLLFGGICLSFLIIVFYDTTHNITNKSTKDMTWLPLLVFYALAMLVGCTLFAAGIEGQTATTIILPFCSIIITHQLFTATNRTLILYFLFCSSCIAAALTLTWGWYFSWEWPEFRVLGLGPFSTWIGKFLRFICKNIFG